MKCTPTTPPCAAIAFSMSSGSRTVLPCSGLSASAPDAAMWMGAVDISSASHSDRRERSREEGRARRDVLCLVEELRVVLGGDALIELALIFATDALARSGRDVDVDVGPDLPVE